MIFVADENVDLGLINELRNQKLQVLSIKETNSGINDINVLEFSFKNNAILITEDKDFGELVHRLKLANKGIILIRLSDLPRLERIDVATKTIIKNQENLYQKFSVLTKNGLRIKS